MNHTDTSTFIKHYRPQDHTQIQQMIFSMEKDEIWDQALNNINQNKNKHHLRFLNNIEKAFIESKPELQKAIHKLDYL
jgi:hypothetical protein